MTVDEYADPEFWHPEDDPGSALYVHRMVVRRSEAGRDLGAVLLDCAEQLAADRRKKWVRLDARRTNTDLHAYYVAHGFTHVRTVCLDHRPSGALFQRPVPMAIRARWRCPTGDALTALAAALVDRSYPMIN
jgi:GNAT superfamily N-acetyltransferase